MSDSMKTNFIPLTTLPASDENFRSCLGDADLETLNKAMEENGRAQSKTRFGKIRAEIRRRCKESGASPYLRLFESYSPEALAEKAELDRRMEVYRRGLPVALTIPVRRGSP